MRQYQELIKEILRDGEWQDNRTGIPSISIPGAHMRFNLEADGFPAVTTKKLAFKSVVGELCAFLRAYRSAADFRALGCKVWDQNANENKPWLANPYRKGEDDLGPVYGVQWRDWPAYKTLYDERHIEAARTAGFIEVANLDSPYTSHNGKVLYKSIDQLGDCVNQIIDNPESRRILFHAWNPAVIDAVALPACHVLYQFFANKKTRKLSMAMYIRSNDVGLGTPFNIAEGAALLELVARLTGYTAYLLNYFVGDAHIYESHIPMINEVLAREPHQLPRLAIDPRVGASLLNGVTMTPVSWLERVEPSDFTLVDYKHHDPISAPMAV